MTTRTLLLLDRVKTVSPVQVDSPRYQQLRICLTRGRVVCLHYFFLFEDNEASNKVSCRIKCYNMSKAAGKLKSFKKVVQKVQHGNKIRTDIPAGMAVAGPPLGPMLGQHGINIAAFCKDFNERTKDLKEGVPLPCRIIVNPDRSYQLIMHKPPATFFIKQAAGLERGAMEPGKEIAGKITLKHLYEIAKIKSEDPPLACHSLKDICKMLVGVAKSCGVEITRNIDADEYGKFLEERRQIVEEQKRALVEKKEARMLRTG